MRNLALLIPAGTVLALVVLCVLPWGLGQSVDFALPALPFAAVHFWLRAHGRLMPLSVVFAAGLAVDVLSYGPLGYWSLVYLSGCGLTTLLDRTAASRSGFNGWAGFCFVAVGLIVIAWLIASIYFLRFADGRAMAEAGALLVLAYPFVQALLNPLDRWVAGPQSLNLERRI